MADVKILYEDSDVIVVVKPAGMASQEERSADMDMVSWLKNYLVREKHVKGVPYIGVVHRLDKPVGGVMVYAKTPQAAKALSKQVQDNKMTKEYLAVLAGTLKKKEGRLEDYLVSDGSSNRSEVASAKAEGARKAVLEYKVKRTKFTEGQQYSLVNIRLITGRRHQIRVQMAHQGAGLLGDHRYNPDKADVAGEHGLALYAWHLAFEHPRNRKKLSFEVPAGAQITEYFS